MLARLIARSFLPQVLLVFCLVAPGWAQAETFPQGVATGDVSATSAIVWTRTIEPMKLRLEWSSEGGDSDSVELETEASADNTVQHTLTALEAATTYRYRFTSVSGDEAAGSFTTAPARDASSPVHFLVGGDLGGQAFCRHADRGYVVFEAMGSLAPDFFIANGDMIYADNPCPADGPGDWVNLPGDFPGIADVDWTDQAALDDAIYGHWRYNRADPHHRTFLEKVPMYVQWDDHEVINDFGLAWPEWPLAPEREGWRALVETGVDALFNFNPMTRHADEPRRIYRSFRWGKDVEVFLLDARSYRSANDLPDTPKSGKTMLGAEQLAWLEKGLIESDATWKIVSSDVPLSLPTGSNAHIWGRDGFADGRRDDFSSRTGAERELLGLLEELDRANVKNLVVVVTDVHLAATLRYQPDLDGDGDALIFHELINGPLNAVAVPTPPHIDATLRPTILYAEGGFFNFSEVRIDGKRLVTTIRDEQGEVRHGSRLEIEAE